MTTPLGLARERKEEEAGRKKQPHGKWPTPANASTKRFQALTGQDGEEKERKKNENTLEKYEQPLGKITHSG